MKKLIIALALALFSLVAFSQERELSDYEKYRMEKEAELLRPTPEEIFYIVEDMPKFDGKDPKEFRKYIAENVRYPLEAAENEIQGKVIISFVVNRHGRVINAKVEQPVDPDLDAEAIRVVESSPKWTPGKQRGEAVAVQFTFPITFILEEKAIVEEEQAATVVNNYYIDYDRDLRHSLYFGSSWYYRPYYRSYYSYYDPFYYDYGWYGYNYYSYGYGYPYYGSYYWGHNNYYHHNYYGYNYYKPYRNNGRYYASSSLGSRRNYYNPSYKTYSNGYVNRPTATKKATVRDPKTYATRASTTNQRSVTTTATRSDQKARTYRPTYAKPRTSTSSSYNRQTDRPSSPAVRTQTRTQTQTSNTYSRPNTPSRSSSSYSRPSTTSRSSSSYSAPSRSSSSYSRSSAPSRSSSSYSRSSTPSRSSSSYSRSSSSSSRSSSGRSPSSSGKR